MRKSFRQTKSKREPVSLNTRDTSSVYEDSFEQVGQPQQQQQLSTGRQDEGKVVMVLGGTGATGSHVLRDLEDDEKVEKILLITRRQLTEEDVSCSTQKVEHVLVDFDDLEASRQVFERPDVAICCLGTTRGKSGVEGLWKIDYEYVVNCAKLLKAGGKCNDFHLVTANGANSDSWFLLYEIKGKVEESVKEVGFRRLSIYRPGLLLTPPRGETRVWEGFAQSLASALDFTSYLSIPIETLAGFIVKNIYKEFAGNEVFEHSDLFL